MPTKDRKTKETKTRYGGGTVAGDVIGRGKVATRVNWQDRIVIDRDGIRSEMNTHGLVPGS